MELVIRTKRLTLKQLGVEDITQKYIDALNDPEVIGLTESRYRKVPMNKKLAREYIENSNKEGESMLIGIFKKDGHKHIGNIRLHTISKHNKRAELGIMIFDKSEWGKGYATESLNAVVKFAFNALDMHKIEAEYYSINSASASIFKKAGFTIEGIIKDHFYINGDFVDAIRIAKLNRLTDGK